MVQRELNVLALIKGQDRYVFVYDDGCQPDLIDAFRQWAADPDLNFNWFDAAVLTEKARQQGSPTSNPPNEEADESALPTRSRIAGV